MKKLILALALSGLCLTACAQAADTSITISSRGLDVREVLHDLFTKAKRSYVMEPTQRIALFLSLEDVEFDEALQIVCQQANLRTELQNGIYYVTKASARKPATAAKDPAVAAPPEKPKGRLSENILNKRLTTRSEKADIRALFSDFSRQTGITLEVDPTVPDYKLDAYLINTSLKYALEQITVAAGLKYRFTDELSIQIYKPADQNRVTIIKN